SIYGLGDFIWIYLHDGLNCSWNNEAIDNIVITDKNGSSIYKKDATIILRSDAGRGNVLQLGLDSIYTSEIRKDSLIISNLPIEFHSIDPSSYDSLLVFWDDPSYKKLSVTCENRITIGSPTVELSDNVYLYSSDLGKQYILPNLIIQDDPIAQFITGSESVIVKIPEAMRNCIAFDESSNIKLYVENDTLIPNINPTDSLFVFEIPDSLALSKYNNKTMYLSGISCSVKESEQVPTSLKYYFNDFPFPDSKKIRIASPSVRFMGNYHNVIDQQGTTNLGENRLIIKEGTVPGLRKGKNINIELCSRKMKNEGIKGFLWKLCPNSQDFSKVDMKKEKLIVETNREFQGNDSTYFSDIKWTVNLDSLQSSTNLFDIFPESVSVCINFRPDEPSQPAWYESQNIIHVHLPVFYTDPSIAGNQLKFSAIKGFLNNKSDGINFKTSNTDPLFMRSRFNPDSLGIQYQMQNEVIDNLELFTITFNDSALFEMNRMFGEYLKAVDDGKYQKELWLGLDFPNIRLSGENGSDYFDWYKSQVSFTGYKPYNLAHVHETGWCFNQDNRFDLEISLDTNYIFTTDLINLCTGDTIIKPEISDSKEYTFIDTTSLYFNDEGLYIFKVNGISATDSCEMFPYTRYLLYDTTSPNLNRSSVRPRIVERHSERNRLSYTGLTISVFDTLRFAVYDNIKTDSSGFRMYLDSINNVVSIPYYFETGNQITIQTVFQDTSAGILSKTNQYYIKSKIDEKSTFRLFDEADQNLWVPVDSLVPDKIEGNLNVVIIIEDASGNISKDTLSYYLILSDGENDLLSQFVFNYPNPFSVYEGTKFR
ncbi:hypothetical protein KJ656_02205, partial [bacterium]|nr:hypothetical protein [bacterium]